MFFPHFSSFIFNLKIHMDLFIGGGVQRTLYGSQFSASTFRVLIVIQSGLAAGTLSTELSCQSSLIFWGRLWYSAHWTQACFIVMDDFELEILLLQSSQYYGNAPSCQWMLVSYLDCDVAWSKWSLLCPTSHSLLLPPSSILLFLTVWDCTQYLWSYDCFL